MLSAQDPFITTWHTKTANEQITIPVQPGLTYRYDIDWENDGAYDMTDVIGAISYIYPTAGDHQIAIRYDFPAIYINNSGDKDKLISIDQWGDIEWQSMEAAFYGASKMVHFAIDTPNLTQVTVMSDMFREASNFNGSIGHWDVSNVTHFLNTFRSTDFNQDISGWDVSNVVNMAGMFREASAFDQDISYWDISKVTDMVAMLFQSNMSIANYDKLLYRWAKQDVRSGVSLGASGIYYCISKPARDSLSMVHGWTISDEGQSCSAPRPFVTTWRTTMPNESITIPTNSNYTYNYNVDWDGDGVYDSIAVTGDITHSYIQPGYHTITIEGGFPAIHINNQGDKTKIINIDQWGDIFWRTMEAAFQGAINLNSDAYDNPYLYAVSDLSNMFRGCEVFNDVIGDWDVSRANYMNSMFFDASSFDQDIGEWDVHNVRDMSFMLGAENFNQDISCWKVDNVRDMSGMFAFAENFNQDISSWNVGNVSNMSSMFLYADNFNQDISSWNVGNVSNMSAMFAYALNFNQDISSWEVDSVQDMRIMFSNAEDFNQDISSWNVANVSNMSHMFSGAINFNQDISSWDVGKVTSMVVMFSGAENFNQDLGDWDISGVENFNRMLDSSGLSQYNYDQTLIGWSQQAVMAGKSLGADGLRYCFAEDARLDLMNNHGWTISEDLKNCDNAQPCATTQLNTWIGPTTGDWNVAANWYLQYVPLPCNDVLIPTGNTVTLSGDGECFSLEVEQGAVLEVLGYELNVWSL